MASGRQGLWPAETSSVGADTVTTGALASVAFRFLSRCLVRQEAAEEVADAVISTQTSSGMANGTS
jgi:hypothetical protein